MRKCSIEGCEDKHEGLGYCRKHYQRFKKHGNPLKTKFIDVCTIEGCDKPHKTKGYCGTHYMRYKSTGSPFKTKNERHGMEGTYIYSKWLGIKQRCYYKGHKQYNNYGGSGIKMCDLWRKSFTAFYEHIGDPPKGDYSIDRIDPYGNYEPGNVRWADRTTQARNRKIHEDPKRVAGVCFNKRDNLYCASIGVSGEKVLLGNFKEEEDAFRSRALGEIKYWGELRQKNLKKYIKND